MHLYRRRPLVAALSAFALFADPSLRLAALAAQQTASNGAAQPAKPAAKPGSQPAAQPASSNAPAAAGPAVDGGWPRFYGLPSGGSILVYQPQIASWDKQKQMVAFAAVSYRTPNAEKPALGTVKLEAGTQVALADRLVNFQPLKITEANFPNVPKEQVREITDQIDKAIPDNERVIALDRVLANLDKSQVIPKNVEGVKADPPAVFFSKTPAVIVNIDGEPIWSPIKENDLKYAVNTNWDLFQYAPTNTYYLRNDASWLKATDVKGPWTAAGTLPASFKKLPAEENWKDVKANLPGKPAASVPKVFVTFKPGELILLTGEPAYKAVGKTNLLWVSNTDSDVFRLGKTGTVYYLVAG